MSHGPWVLVLAATAATATACEPAQRCGPSSGVVAEVIDGDTIELESGERIRYLMVDTPETTGGSDDCFGSNAVQFNTDLVLGKTVQLTYDQECTDAYDRLLAYVTVDGQELNALLVERGYACVLQIAPNGVDRVDEFEALERAARDAARGLWGNCEPEEILCD